jgi:hypothetical protein
MSLLMPNLYTKDKLQNYSSVNVDYTIKICSRCKRNTARFLCILILGTIWIEGSNSSSTNRIKRINYPNKWRLTGFEAGTFQEEISEANNCHNNELVNLLI